MPDPAPTGADARRSYPEAFWHAMATLPKHGAEPAQAGAALALWYEIAERGPSTPDIVISEGVKFSWFGPRYALDVEVMRDRRVAWYFRDSSLPLGQSEGTGDLDEPVERLPARFWECLALAGAERADAGNAPPVPGPSEG